MLASFLARCKKEVPTILLDTPAWPWLLDHDSFKELASEMARRIDAASPGPLALAGYSIGATLAALAAAELHAKGRTVRAVFAMDPVLPRRSAASNRLWATKRRRAYAALQRGLPEALGFVQVRIIRGMARLVAPRLARLRPPVLAALRYAAPAGSIASREIAMQLMIDCAARWAPSAAALIDVPCVLFHSASAPLDDAFWLERFAQVTPVSIGGDHHDILTNRGPAAMLGAWQSILAGCAILPSWACRA